MIAGNEAIGAAGLLMNIRLLSIVLIFKLSGFNRVLENSIPGKNRHYLIG